MTLKEIVKLIEEADLMLDEEEGEEHYVSLKTEQIKVMYELNIEDILKRKDVLSFYKRDKNSGEITLLTKVDYIDPEKKIIKKKLDDMTQEEIEQVSGRICFENTCQKCPFTDNNNLECLAGFLDWKKRYLDNKDREFEIEVEE